MRYFLVCLDMRIVESLNHMPQFNTVQDIFDATDNVEAATNMAVAVDSEAVYIALFSDAAGIVYIKVSYTEFKDMAKAVIEQVSIGLN